MKLLALLFVLAQVVNQREVSLAWDASLSADVAGYDLLRSPTPIETIGKFAGKFADPVVVPVGNFLTHTLSVPAGTWYFAVVAKDAAGKSAVYSNAVSIQVDATPPVLSGTLSAALLETFEASGTDSAYTETMVAPGNYLDPEFSSAAAGNPPGWGSQCLRIVIGASPPNGGALYRRVVPTSATGFVTKLDWILAGSAIADGKGIVFAVAKAEGEPELAALCWRLYFYRTGPDLHFLFVAGEGANQVSWRWPATGSISGGTLYEHQIEYNIQAARVYWTVNGNAVVNTALLAAYPQNIGLQVIGSSGSSDGRDVTMLMDRIAWTEIAVP